MTRALLCVAVLAGFAVGIAPPPLVAIVSAPAFATDQQSLTIRVRVEPDPENRRLTLAAVQDDVIVRRSDEDLDGAAAPRTRWVTWYPLPEGEFVLVAVVWGTGYQRGRDWRTLTVIGMR